MPNPYLEAALSYARKGWRVFPLQDAGTPSAKEPRGKTHGFIDGTVDEIQIKKWWDEWPNANIGITTGMVSGLLVYDIDSEIGEYNTLELQEKNNERFLSTYEVKTSRGRQLYFEQPVNQFTKSSVGTKGLGEGIDIRGDGGYVVAPPSIHPSGFVYALVRDILPAKLPEWLLNFCLRDKPSGSTHKKKDNTLPDKVKKGARDAFLASEAGRHRSYGMVEIEIAAALHATNLVRCEPPMEESVVLAKAKYAMKYEPNHFNKVTGAEIEAEMLSQNLAEFESKPVTWRWPGKIPDGMLIIWSGDPGQGKSTVAYTIAAAVTQGQKLPGDDTPLDYMPGMVLILSAEDDMLRTIRPRLDLAGADLSLVRNIPPVMSNGKPVAFPAHKEELKRLIVDLDAKLLIIDPLDAFLGGSVDSHNNASVRSVLAPLSELANETGIIIIVISHLNKSSNSAAMYRISGSIAFTGAARVACILATSQVDPELHLFGVLKNNLAKVCKPMQYRIMSQHMEGLGEMSKIVWEGESKEETVITMLAAPAIANGDGEAIAEAKAFLLQELMTGPKPAKEIQRTATKEGVAHMTLRRAMKEIGSKRPREGQWMWALKGYKWQEELKLEYDEKGEL